MLASVPTWICLVIGGAVGAALASWLSACAYRIPRRMNISSDRSICPHCQSQIAGRDNVPLFGWLMLRGRCRTCHEPIPRRELAYELAGAAVGAVAIFIHLYLLVVIAIAAIAIPLALAAKHGPESGQEDSP
ncbi:prepilin peptidase [Miltoncostaea oceani]|uniref:prepilin peptidase n=1 Tax=Miltoncostaea oceani TaxID=2843216 RepID=UPI001C3D27E8|nr:prepilin peptidase [Miltoncostaea oceani]